VFSNSFVVEILWVLEGAIWVVFFHSFWTTRSMGFYQPRSLYGDCLGGSCCDRSIYGCSSMIFAETKLRMGVAWRNIIKIKQCMGIISGFHCFL